jgi:hypothetical protein
MRCHFKTELGMSENRKQCRIFELTREGDGRSYIMRSFIICTLPQMLG